MEIEDFFAQAVDRLLAGESIDDIVVSYAPSIRVELRGLLVVVEAAERMATATVPAPASLNRVSARLLFAQRTAELRAGLEAAQDAVPLPAAQPNQPPASRTPGVWQSLRNWWDTVGPPAPVFRFAPLTLVLIAAYLLTFTVVVAAQGSLPGDQIYGLKKWMFNQRLATAPPELVATELGIIAKEQEEDVSKTAVELNTRPEAKAVEAVGILQYVGEDPDFMYFGNLLVTKGYRTDVNDPDTWTPMSGDGELQPGALVMLRYQIVPGMMGVVEGIDFELIPEPPLPTPTPTPTPTPLPGGGCQRVQSSGWTPYALGDGETLRDIAARSNVSSEELRKVNCLTNGPVRSGTTIYVPARIAAPPQPLQLVITVTPTPAATPVPPTAPPTVTPTSTPRTAATATESPTGLPAATATTPAAETPGAGVTDSATPTDTTGGPTAEATPSASATPAAPGAETPASGTPTPDATTDTPPPTTGSPAGSPTAEGETATPATAVPATGTPTPASSVTPSSSPTPAATTTPTTLASATPAATATSMASLTATANASPVATATPGAGASPTTAPAASATTAPAATATSAPPTPTQVIAPTATDVTSSASGGSAATNTPTVAPTATSVPPTAAPPPTATKPPPATSTPVPPPPTAPPVPPPPTATPVPPPPTASTSDSSESP